MAYKRNIEIFEEAYEKKDAKSVVSYVARDGRRRYIAGNKNPDGGGNMPSGGGMVEVTWQELKDKRDIGELNPGSLYRITDYNCTTTQENTRSAGHQFDIVLLALSENKLAEEGWAMMHDNIYDVTFSDGVTKKCYYYPLSGGNFSLVICDTLLGTDEIASDECTIDESSKTMVTDWASTDLTAENLTYNYFQNSNLSAWKVWYCLDNDTTRFAWADDSVDEDAPAFIIAIGRKGEISTFYRDSADDLNNLFAWKKGVGTQVYTASQTPSVGDTIYDGHGTATEYTVNSYTPAHEGTGLPNGRGVIYRLIDEFNNDIKYDFKNIQFKRTITDGAYDETGTETWCYTLNVWYNDMCQDASIVGNILTNDEGMITGVYNNLIEAIGGYLFHDQNARQALSDNCILSVLDEDHHYYGIQNCSIDASSMENTISLESIENICLKWSSRNKIKGIGAIFMDCYNFSYNSDQGGIYIHNKRVLTES